MLIILIVMVRDGEDDARNDDNRNCDFYDKPLHQKVENDDGDEKPVDQTLGCNMMLAGCFPSLLRSPLMIRIVVIMMISMKFAS